MIALLHEVDGVARDVLLLARPLGDTAALLEVALTVQHEGTRGLRMAGPPEVDVLRGGAAAVPERPSALVNMGARFLTTDIPKQGLRRVMRVRSWTPWARMVATLLAPRATAVTHNPLLIGFARHARDRLDFRHAAPLLDQVVRAAGGTPGILQDGDALAERALVRLTDDPTLSEPYRGRLRTLLRPVYGAAIRRADRTLGALRGYRGLPGALWSGTGGFYPARALGMEVKRRGGSVRRFDHGGTMTLLDDPEFLAHQELMVSTDFVVPSPAAAAQPMVAAAVDLARPCGSVRIEPGSGDRSLDPGRPGSGNRPRAGRPRVLFVTTAFYGLSQTYPPFAPPPVYLDWQHRILKMLAALPIDLVHKPHPGGLFRGRIPGVAGLARIDLAPFEAVMDDVDCFVFDVAASTTFSIALSSDRRVVLLDFGGLRFGASIRPLIRERCRIVPVTTDDRNRAVIDAEALEAAIFAPGPDPDPSAFRRHFLAEGSG